MKNFTLNFQLSPISHGVVAGLTPQNGGGEGGEKRFTHLKLEGRKGGGVSFNGGGGGGDGGCAAKTAGG